MKSKSGLFSADIRICAVREAGIYFKRFMAGHVSNLRREVYGLFSHKCTDDIKCKLHRVRFTANSFTIKHTTKTSRFLLRKFLSLTSILKGQPYGAKKQKV